MLSNQYSPFFVVLALLVAVFGAWTSLDLFRRLRTHIGASRLIWLSGAAVALGCSIWSMHFLAMLDFDATTAGRYDPRLTLLSLVLVVSACCGAFLLAARPRAQVMDVLAAGAVMGAGICMMHYVGMAASKTVVSYGYSAAYVALSLVIAVSSATAALFAARREGSGDGRILAAMIMGGANVAMHFTAIMALNLRPAGHIADAGINTYALGLAVAGSTLLVLFLALLASLYDQRGDIMQALDGGGVGYWELDPRSGVISLSARAKEILGFSADEDVGDREIERAIHPDERAKRRKLLDSALRSGADLDAEYRLFESGRYVNVRAKMIKTGRGKRLVGVVLDVTDRHEAFAVIQDNERRQRILINELNHRVKNTLATIQSLAGQTAKGALGVEDYRQTFESRLLALSSTHDALTRSGWQMASLQELVEHELRPYGPERVIIAGDDVRLQPKQALALGMVLHELATNAAKYGALSAPGGLVHLVWTETPDRRLRLRWCEMGGPRVAAPSRKGFGTRLIQSSIEHELGGSAVLDYEPEGLIARLEAPLREAETADMLEI